MSRLGGRQTGTRNMPALDRIKSNKARLEKLLLDQALAGDTQAIEACLRRISEVEALEGKKDKVSKTKTPVPQTLP